MKDEEEERRLEEEIKSRRREYLRVIEYARQGIILTTGPLPIRNRLHLDWYNYAPKGTHTYHCWGPYMWVVAVWKINEEPR